MMDPQSQIGAAAAVIARAVDGDAAAWERLMRVHQEPVFRYAYLLLGDVDEAEDAAQETFIKAHRALHRFDRSRPLRPWLLKIVSNQASNRRRSMGRYWGALKRLAQLEPEKSKAGLFLDEDRAALWEAIQKLSALDRQVIYLRFFLQMPVEEAAQAMGIPSGTVKSRTSRALRRLKTLIETHYPDLQPD